MTTFNIAELGTHRINAVPKLGWAKPTSHQTIGVPLRKPLRILLVTHEFPPQRAGAGTLTHYLALGLTEIGHKVGASHRISNLENEPLAIVEVQIGDDSDEDDIERL